MGKLVGGHPGQGLAGFIGQAGGSPLYTRELADELLRAGQLRLSAGMAELADQPSRVPMPISLTGVIGERLDVLADDVVAALRWAAVLSAEVSVADLEVVSGRSAGDLIDVFDAALSAGVVAEAGQRLRFRHGLIRRVLYERMPAGLRATLHVQAARALADAGAAPCRAADASLTARAALRRGDLSQAWTARLTALDALIQLVMGLPDQDESVFHDALATAERTGDRIAIGYSLHAMSLRSQIRRDKAGILDLASRGLAVVGDDPQATDLRLLMQARPWFRASNAAVLAARRGDQAAARRALAAAVAVYQALGAAWDIHRAGARLRPFGIQRRRPAYSGRPISGWSALTPTEVKVADLVAGGKSNPDIAAELFLSRNTVQTRVSHILTKLDARSRVEIAAEALDHTPSSDRATA